MVDLSSLLKSGLNNLNTYSQGSSAQLSQPSNTGFSYMSPNFTNNSQQTAGPATLGTQNSNTGGINPNPGGAPGGGGSGGGSIPTNNQNTNTNQNQNSGLPPAPSFSDLYGAQYAAANQQFDAAKEATNSALSANQQAIQSQADITKNTLGTDYANATEANTQNVNKESTNFDTSQNSTREQYNEISQGIQSLYGGSTGTGFFASDVAGRQAMANLGQNLNNHVETMRQLNNQKVALTKDYNDKVFSIDSQTATLKQQAKAAADAELSQISSNQALLESQKAAQKLDLLKTYTSFINDIYSRVAQEKSTLAYSISNNLAGLNSLGAEKTNEFYSTLMSTFQNPMGSYQGIAGNNQPDYAAASLFNTDPNKKNLLTGS